MAQKNEKNRREKQSELEKSNKIHFFSNFSKVKLLNLIRSGQTSHDVRAAVLYSPRIRLAALVITAAKFVSQKSDADI